MIYAITATNNIQSLPTNYVTGIEGKNISIFTLVNPTGHIILQKDGQIIKIGGRIKMIEEEHGTLLVVSIDSVQCSDNGSYLITYGDNLSQKTVLNIIQISSKQKIEIKVNETQLEIHCTSQKTCSFQKLSIYNEKFVTHENATQVSVIMTVPTTDDMTNKSYACVEEGDQYKTATTITGQEITKCLQEKGYRNIPPVNPTEGRNNDNENEISCGSIPTVNPTEVPNNGSKGQDGHSSNLKFILVFGLLRLFFK
ncbi:uncharacterized protein LOC117107777 isoform X2 [Anneissia japonica]|nr:uncharacterized protein LOC117107777 isoform X2 [Anneissia japonica]